jgi:hypothetical protein
VLPLPVVAIMLILCANRNDFVCEKKSGKGATVYVIDSGVNVDVKDVSTGILVLLRIC